MRFYIIGNKDSSLEEYSYAENWLKLNGHTVINPKSIRIDGISDNEFLQLKMHMIAFVDYVLVLDKMCDICELIYAKSLGKKIKYLSKQWKLKRKESRETYKTENNNDKD